MHQLRHPDDHALETEQRRRARVQRLRSVLQTPRRQQAADHEEGRYPDAEEETEKATAAVVFVVVVVQRVRERGEQQAVDFRGHRSTRYARRPVFLDRGT